VRTLWVLRGLPGAGKSTLAAELKEAFGDDCAICEADDYMIEGGAYNFTRQRLRFCHDQCRLRCETRMLDGVKHVIVANTSVAAWEFEKYLTLAKVYEYQVRCLVVENRHGGESTHGVPLEQIELMRARFDLSL
jgi:2',3'-cyclic-nucleotide 3'-phosphodiesterase